MLGSFGITELLIILAIIMILFGAKRLPELAKGLGQGINEFKKASRHDSEEGPAQTQSKTTSTSEEVR